MSEEKEIRRAFLTGERALFAAHDLHITDTTFADGESPLKESSRIALDGCMFKWKYPLWYAHDITVKNSTWFEMARAGVWYSDDVRLTGCAVDAPKNFRRCRRLTLEDVSIPDAAETLWHCSDVTLQRVVARGDYFAMDCDGMQVDGLTLYGNYSFDGAKNVTIRSSRLLSKDAFWNSEDVTVYDSFISGEYLGWNAKNLTLIDCTIESLQGLCYIDGLVLKNCKLLNTTLAFEYSTVDADIDGSVDSVLDPAGGIIRAERIGELTIRPDRVDPSKTQIILRDAQ